MKVFHYDIYDEDKGIILAKTEKGAIRKFRQEYPGVPICHIDDTDDYDSGVARIDYAGETNGKTQLIFLEC